MLLIALQIRGKQDTDPDIVESISTQRETPALWQDRRKNRIWSFFGIRGGDGIGAARSDICEEQNCPFYSEALACRKAGEIVAYMPCEFFSCFESPSHTVLLNKFCFYD